MKKAMEEITLKSRITQTCPACDMLRSDWPHLGYKLDGILYCCQGCAEEGECTCQTTEENDGDITE